MGSTLFTKATAFSTAWHAAQVEGTTDDDRARGLLAAFRGELYRCFAMYRDALLELANAVLCKPGAHAGGAHPPCGSDRETVLQVDERHDHGVPGAADTGPSKRGGELGEVAAQ